MSLIVSIRIRAGINGVGVPSGRRCDPCVAVPFVCRPCPAVPRCVTAPGVPVSRRRCAAPAAAMEPRCPPWLQRCPRPCRLLLLSLCSGPAGAVAALRALQRGRPRHGAGLPFPWPALTAALCAEEPSLEGPEDALAVKPRLLLLPVLCQRNLFSLLLVVQDAVPRDCLHQLLQALEKDSHVDPWVQALGDLLQQGPSAQESSPHPTALSAGCQQQLKGLCQKIAQQKPERQGKLSWCFSKQAGAPDSVPQGGERKEVSEESLEVDSEREGKRLLEEVAFEPQECGDVAEVEEEMPEEPSGDASAQGTEKAAQDSSQQDAAGEPRRISQTELAAEVQSFVQVLSGVCCPLPAREPLLPDSHSFISFPSGARTGAEDAAAAGVQCKWLLLSLSWSCCSEQAGARASGGVEKELDFTDGDKKPCWHLLWAWDTNTCLHPAGVRGCLWAQC
uniref:FA complementation group E n=2 Tax=Junco hyemalis TaxID=40217 RepID=A0A8C5JMS5_JUNHY